MGLGSHTRCPARAPACSSLSPTGEPWFQEERASAPRRVGIEAAIESGGCGMSFAAPRGRRRSGYLFELRARVGAPSEPRSQTDPPRHHNRARPKMTDLWQRQAAGEAQSGTHSHWTAALGASPSSPSCSSPVLDVGGLLDLRRRLTRITTNSKDIPTGDEGCRRPAAPADAPRIALSDPLRPPLGRRFLAIAVGHLPVLSADRTQSGAWCSLLSFPRGMSVDTVPGSGTTAVDAALLGRRAAPRFGPTNSPSSPSRPHGPQHRLHGHHRLPQLRRLVDDLDGVSLPVDEYLPPAPRP